MQPDLNECDCGNADCPTCSYAAIDPYEDDAMPDPVPAPDPAAELARVVAWLMARRGRLRDLSDETPDRELSDYFDAQAFAIEEAAVDLERGEQP